MINTTQIALYLDNAQAVLEAFQAARDAATDDEWDAMNAGPLGALMDALSELEYTAEQ